MPIRPARREDAAEIAQLIRELAGYERLAGEVVWETDGLEEALFGEGSPVRILLAEGGGGGGDGGAGGGGDRGGPGSGEIAGFALYFETFSTFLGKRGIWLEDLFVREQFRGRGLGRELLTFLRQLTSGRVEWSVLDWNADAIAFYESLGARPVRGWTTYRWLPPEEA